MDFRNMNWAFSSDLLNIFNLISFTTNLTTKQRRRSDIPSHQWHTYWWGEPAGYKSTERGRHQAGEGSNHCDTKSTWAQIITVPTLKVQVVIQSQLHWSTSVLHIYTGTTHDFHNVAAQGKNIQMTCWFVECNSVLKAFLKCLKQKTKKAKLTQRSPGCRLLCTLWRWSQTLHWEQRKIIFNYFHDSAHWQCLKDFNCTCILFLSR